MNEELKKLIDQLRSLRVPTAQIEAMAKSVRDAKEGTKEHNAALENMRARVQAVREAADFAGESFSNLTSILRENLKELTKKEDSQKRLIKSTKGIVDLSQELTYHEEEITDYSEKQLAKKIETAKQNKKLMSQAVEEQIRTLSHLGLQAKMGNEAFHAKVNELVTQGKITKEQANTFREYKKGFPIVQGVIDKGEEQLNTQKRVNETLGITGALTKGLAGVFGKLGIEGSALQHGIEDANKAMKKAAKDGGGKLKAAFIGVGHVLGGVVKQLNDPVFIGGFMFKAALEGADHINEVERALGLTTEESAKLVKGLEDQARASDNAFINTTRLTHAVVGLSDEMGIFATSADPTNLEGFARLTENLGYSKDAAASLIATLELHGQTMDDFEGSIDSTVNQFNRATKSNVTMKAVMDDVVNASAALKVTIGDTPEGLIEAATAARGLGVSLSQVEKISESLLDFQSSIDAEMEAQLMTGKALNLAKAREAALMGDQKTVAEEIGKQQAVQEAFATKNVLAQNAVAKSLGLSREELAVMYKQQQLTNLGAERFAEIYNDQTLAQIEARNAADAFADTMGKLKDAAMQAFLPLGEALLGITRTLATLVSMPGVQEFVKYFVPAALGAMILAKTINGVASAVKGISSAFDLVKSGFKGLTKMISGFGSAASTAAETTANVVSNTTEAASNAANQASQNAGNQGGGMIERFNKLDTKSLLRAAGAMVILSAALYISAKAFQEFADVEWQDVALGIGGMIGLAAVAKIISKGSKEMIMGAVAIGLLGLAMIPLATALSKLAGVNMDGVLAAAAGLVIFSAAAFALGALFSSGVGAVLFGAGLLGIMALAVAIQPLGKALTEAAPGFAAFGQAMSSLSIESAKALALTGVGLVGLTAGLLGLAAVSLLGSPIGMLSDLAALAPGLAVVGTSLTAIAAGVSALSSALDKLEVDKIDELKDLVVTTAFAAPAVAATGAITELISGITGGGGGDSDKALLDKIDRLIAAVESGGDVYIDGNKAGRAINLATYKSA